MNRVYFVRHGETEWNHSGKYQGSTDVPLSEVGLDQARKCAAALRDVEFDYILSSDLTRALVTAQTINDGRHIPLEKDPGVREICFGDWEGLTYEEISARWPGAVEKMYESPTTVEISHGESFKLLQDRAWASVKMALGKLQDGDTLLVVCHGGTIRALICAMLHIPLDFAWNFRQGNTAISYVDYFGDDSINTLGLLNKMDHIEGLR